MYVRLNIITLVLMGKVGLPRGKYSKTYKQYIYSQKFYQDIKLKQSMCGWRVHIYFGRDPRISCCYLIYFHLPQAIKAHTSPFIVFLFSV